MDTFNGEYLRKTIIQYLDRQFCEKHPCQAGTFADMDRVEYIKKLKKSQDDFLWVLFVGTFKENIHRDIGNSIGQDLIEYFKTKSQS